MIAKAQDVPKFRQLLCAKYEQLKESKQRQQEAETNLNNGKKSGPKEKIIILTLKLCKFLIIVRHWAKMLLKSIKTMKKILTSAVGCSRNFPTKNARLSGNSLNIGNSCNTFSLSLLLIRSLSLTLIRLFEMLRWLFMMGN
jgi:hypothetical protein